jgi:membrane protein CcdC involved in cytochrome C biogenesis
MEATSKRKAKKPCKLCKRIRYFMMVLAAIVIMKLLVPGARLPEGYDYARIAGDVALLAFLGVFVWKFWEYRREKKRQDELADIEPWRLAIREAAQARRARQ